MSLYGGIKFTAPTAPQQQAEEQPSASSTPASTSATSDEPAKTTAPAQHAKTNSAVETSTALKFAPRINKKSSRPALPASAPVVIPHIGISSKPDIVRAAEPVLTRSESSGKVNNDKEDEVVLGQDGVPLAQAPSMTLDPKGRTQAGGGDRKRKNKKRKSQQQPHLPTFNPDEEYDPARPNDLGEYQDYRVRAKEERRRQFMEAKKRKADGLDSDESSYYSDSDEDYGPRRDAPKMFAPPKMYSPPSSKALLAPPETSAPVAPPSAIPQSADEAYARRVAMSQPRVSSGGDDGYDQRPSFNQQHPTGSATSGNDAFARRVAMSQGLPQSNMPSFVSSSSSLPNNAPPSNPPNVFVPPAPAPAPPKPLDSQAVTSASDEPKDQKEFEATLAERKKAAEAIAAKFKNPKAYSWANAPPDASSSANVSLQDVEGGTFAEKMMRKMGHVEGSGLGARGEGIVHALTAEHVAPPTNINQPLSKRALAKQKAAAANTKNRKWVQSASSRGKIVNANEAKRATEERGQKGEEGRVICLRGMVGSEEEIDEDLADEIGEECSKHGIVERVLLHMVEPPPPEPEECLRVFVVFSGMAGAWKAQKELDGRFFAGRTIKATYFDEERFNRGERDGPVL
ncbi:hypothetical protein B9479_003344 [Cryptococcus floricola]|uniref:G-patch domain-containing protein n=1 Tax=Cryptococcus floricola TaxID=2591691 RepID=A0A5D3B0K8_9TREE|nr:hypothetical protein B9479_003344 [Cryptococcus floricola]